MQVLRRGSEGENVRRWQSFLVGQGALAANVDGVFGPMTEAATKKFQTKTKIEVDGTVGPLTYAAALQKGFDPGIEDPLGGSSGADWPPRPSFSPLISNLQREQEFGKFNFQRIASGKDDIKILGGWVAANIVSVVIPQLAKVRSAPASGSVRFHKRVAEQSRALFDAWDRNGLMRLVLTWEGSFVPRYVRGSSSTLSNHAWGTAFDINYAWNKLGSLPALRGRTGSVRELVPLANEFGFYWGGHFKGRADGMHFEVARPLG